MNTLKYRVWSKLLNIWVTDLYLENMAKSDDMLNDLLGNENLIFQRMIGQKDYVGTDIYEGDLLEPIANFKNPKTYECKYSIDRVSFIFQSGDVTLLWKDFITHYGLKPVVKGNILEKTVDKI